MLLVYVDRCDRASCLVFPLRGCSLVVGDTLVQYGWQPFGYGLS